VKLPRVAFLLMMGALFSLWLFGCTAFAANGFVATPSVNDQGQVVISWETPEPTFNASVHVAYLDPTGKAGTTDLDYRSDFRDSNPQPATSHAIVLRGIQPDKLYHYRAQCVVAANGVTLSSNDQTFRVIKTPEGKLRIGLAPVLLPTVNCVERESVTLAWETNLPAKALINVYDLKGVFVRRVVVSEPATRFEVKIDHLTYGWGYTYEIMLTAADFGDMLVLGRYSFRTARKPGSDFCFAVMGDSRAQSDYPSLDYHLNNTNYAALSQMIRQAKARGAELVLFTGDLVSGGAQPDLQLDSWFKACQLVWTSVPIYASAGNHEHGLHSADTPWDALWRKWMVLPDNGPKVADASHDYSELVYSFDYGSCHFVSLCCELPWADSAIDDDQLAWLEQDLAAASKRGQAILVFAHEPAYPTGGHIHSSLDAHPAQRDKFWALLDKYKVKAYFCGHEHNYVRLAVDKRVNPNWKHKVYQIVTGRAGAPWYPVNYSLPYSPNIESGSTDYHFVLVQVKHKQLSVKVYNRYGEVIDSFKF